MARAVRGPFPYQPKESQMAKAADDTSGVPSVMVRLLRSHWIGPERHDPGEEIIVPLNDQPDGTKGALTLLSKGVAERTDELKAE
jgi:hypothetical protein